LFLPEQPDLDWTNPELRAAMHGVLRFWLDRGIDGFRVDVVHALGKDPALPDDPPPLAGLPHCAVHDDESTHSILRELRRVADAYPGDRVLVGEVFIIGPHEVRRYYGRGDELHLCFDLPAVLHTPWDAEAWKTRMESVLRDYAPTGAWPTLVLSNHDTPRHRTRFGSEARARVAAVLLLTLPGTPFLYAGEELGLEDAVVPRERRVDPGGRDGCRAPIPWEASPPHGWGAKPWLPWAPEPAERSVETERADPSSILHLYRRLLAARRGSPALQAGSWTALEARPGVLAYRRDSGDDRRVVAVNFSPEMQEWRPPSELGALEIEVATSGDGAFSGAIAPESAILFRPVRR
jgi:alpha-glucosidase